MDCGLRTTDYGLGIKYGLSIKRGLENNYDGGIPKIHIPTETGILADVSIYETGLERLGLVIFAN